MSEAVRISHLVKYVQIAARSGWIFSSFCNLYYHLRRMLLVHDFTPAVHLESVELLQHSP